MKPIQYCVLLLVSICFNLSAQINIDSLNQELSIAKNKDKIPILISLAKHYIYASDSVELGIEYAIHAKDLSTEYEDVESQIISLQYLGKAYRFIGLYNESLTYSRDALNISRSKKNKEETARSLINLGLLYFQVSDYEQAVSYYDEAMSIKKELGDEKGYGIALNNIANCYYQLGNYTIAIEYYNKAFDIFDRLGFSTGIASTLNGLGMLLEQQDRYEEALENYQKAFLIIKESGIQSEIANFLNNMGNMYMELNHYDSAIYYYNQALSIREQIGDKPGISNSYNNIGLAYLDMKNYNLANGYIQQAIDINKEINNLYELSLNINALSRSYIETKNYPKALEYAQQGLKIAHEINSPESEIANYESLSEIYEKTGKTGKALEYYKLLSSLRDTLNTSDLQQRITEMQVKYETKEKQQQLDLLSEKTASQQMKLQRNRYVLTGLGILILLAILMGVLLIRQNKLKSKQRHTELEQKLLRSQMNPHFLFNSLIAIQSFVLKKQDKEAVKYLTGFAKLMRLILENSRAEHIPLDKEITTLQHYLELQKLRFEHKFDFEIILDKDIIPETIAIPPMLAQPFIENSIEHGILNKSEKGQIQIAFKRKDDFIQFQLEDNGVGREKAGLVKKEKMDQHESLATSITIERLNNLNKKLKHKFTFTIIDLKNKEGEATGTKVIINIPVKEIF